MSDPIKIRAEEPGDELAIRRVNELAFGRPAEADLVDDLRAAGAMTLSLVAVIGKEIVGHILFSPVAVESGTGTFIAAGLGPMAVLPEHQGRGVGSRLVREGTDELSRVGHPAVVVLGHPPYYPRFGFQPASRFGLRWEKHCDPEAFMAIELRPGALAGKGGVVRYRPEFDRA